MAVDDCFADPWGGVSAMIDLETGGRALNFILKQVG
jgi:hypothetical protein